MSVWAAPHVMSQRGVPRLNGAISTTVAGMNQDGRYGLVREKRALCTTGLPALLRGEPA